MGQTKLKVVYTTPPEYSQRHYPKLYVHGRWFEEFGFLWRDEVFIAPRSKNALAVINPRINGSQVLPILAKTRVKRLSTSIFGYAALLLQGRWLWLIGFSAGDHVEISNPSAGIMHIEILRSGDEIEAERDERKRLGMEEWRLFKDFLMPNRNRNKSTKAQYYANRY